MEGKIIIVSRSFVHEGAAEIFLYHDVTDSAHSATIPSGKDLKSQSWDRDVMKVTTTHWRGYGRNYSLAPDSAMNSVARPERKPIHA